MLPNKWNTQSSQYRTTMQEEKKIQVRASTERYLSEHIFTYRNCGKTKKNWQAKKVRDVLCKKNWICQHIQVL